MEGTANCMRNSMKQALLEKMNQARGLSPVDLVLTGARLVNVLSGEIEEDVEIGIAGGCFLGTGCFAGKEVLDCGGGFVVPGLIDAHVHIESSMVRPEAFWSVLLAHGVITAIVDPHEIANVLGADGIRYILAATEDIPANCFLALPSCVPSTRLESSGAKLTAEDLAVFIDHPRVVALGEVMDVPAVLRADPDMVAKLSLPLGVRDGHAPGLGEQDLNAYHLAGIMTDHECSTPEEARARLRKGFRLLLREGTVAKNLRDLLPAVNQWNARHCLLATDDRHPTDLLTEGSIDHLVRLAIGAGQPALRVIQMATLNTARAYRLQGLGAVAPGYQADFLLVDSLENFQIEAVYHKGCLVSKRSELTGAGGVCSSGFSISFGATGCVNTVKEADSARLERQTPQANSVRLGRWEPERLRVQLPAGYYRESAQQAGGVQVNVIGLVKNQLRTEWLQKKLPVDSNGYLMADPMQDIAKLAVIERHRASGRTGIGFVHGFGLREGAIATTVAHDSHNLLVLGSNDADMNLAVCTCASMGGGLCVVKNGVVLGNLPLPIAGLMSLEDMPGVAASLTELIGRASETGIPGVADPFMTLSFLSLPVIPQLKLTDRGLIDVERARLVGLLPENEEQ